jgi:hypothetical protein
MSNKTEIVVLKASYRKVFSAIFRRVSFSTATGDYTQQPHERARERAGAGQSQERAGPGVGGSRIFPERYYPVNRGRG